MLNVPVISRTQWHPFTISSAASDAYISVHIRHVGDERHINFPTFGIIQVIEDTATSTTIALALPIEIYIPVEGPFGAPAELVYRDNAAICADSGTGITS